MEDQSISDSQITASSYDVLNEYKPHLARLNNQGSDFWSASVANPSNPWIQVDFLTSVELHGIQTQGSFYSHPVIRFEEFVTKLNIQTGDSEDSLTFIEDESGNPQVIVTDLL